MPKRNEYLELVSLCFTVELHFTGSITPIAVISCRLSKDIRVFAPVISGISRQVTHSSEVDQNINVSFNF